MQVLLTILLFLIPFISSAATTYEMEYSDSVQQYDSSLPNNSTSTNRYDFRYRLPVGVTFDRVQIYVPTTQGVPSKTPYFAKFDSNDYFEDCSDNSCGASDTQIIQLLPSASTNPVPTVIQYVFSTTTRINNSDEYFRFIFDPNPTYSTILYYQTLDSIGYSENGFGNLRVNAAPTVKFCNGACDDFDFSPQPSYPSPYGFDDTHNTRILSATVSATSGVPTFNVQYYLDNEEISTTTSSRNPQQLRFQTGSATTTDLYTAFSSTITPWSYGTSSATSTYPQVLPDGQYETLITFSNNGTLFGQPQPFPRSQLYIVFTLSSGNVVAQSVTQVNDTTQQTPFQPLSLNCSFTDILACIEISMRWLFVPSQTAITNLTSLVSESSIPFVANAYQYYVISQSALEIPANSSTTLNYTLEIPEAGIEVQMFSAALLTNNLGSAAPIFRSIALAVLMIGFLAMITTTIRNQISVTAQTTHFSGNVK